MGIIRIIIPLFCTCLVSLKYFNFLVAADELHFENRIVLAAHDGKIIAGGHSTAIIEMFVWKQYNFVYAHNFFCQLEEREYLV